MEKYNKQLKEIAIFAKNNGYDLKELNKEKMKEIIKSWYKNNLKFYKLLEEAPQVVQKSMLGIK